MRASSPSVTLTLVVPRSAGTHPSRSHRVVGVVSIGLFRCSPPMAIDRAVVGCRDRRGGRGGCLGPRPRGLVRGAGRRFAARGGLVVVGPVRSGGAHRPRRRHAARWRLAGCIGRCPRGAGGSPGTSGGAAQRARHQRLRRRDGRRRRGGRVVWCAVARWRGGADAGAVPGARRLDRSRPRPSRRGARRSPRWRGAAGGSGWRPVLLLRRTRRWRGGAGDRRGDRHPVARVRLGDRDGLADRHGDLRSRARHQFDVARHVRDRHPVVGARHRGDGGAGRRHRLCTLHRDPSPRVPGSRPLGGGFGGARGCHRWASRGVRGRHGGDRDPRSGCGRRAVHDRSGNRDVGDRADHGARLDHVAPGVSRPRWSLDQPDRPPPSRAASRR